jgi:CDP-glucose 4,6-dehydratase
MVSDLENIYKGKLVLVTGHTGFKGSWLSLWLIKLGAKVIGLSNLDSGFEVYHKTKLKEKLFADLRGDVTNINELFSVVGEYKPDFVFHLAAQAMVRTSYDEPVLTYKTNVLGTANILEAIRKFDFLKGGVMITTDKCYKDKNKIEGYNEEDELGGYDPYAASKACAELVINSYNQSFFKNSNKYVASVRAGNVIGGGDRGENRLIPDSIRSLENNQSIKVRNPAHVRPWQFVLEPLYGYLIIGSKLLEEKSEFVSAWNFGPLRENCVPVGALVNLIVQTWGTGVWEDLSNPLEKKHETKLLYLDSKKVMNKTNWKPVVNLPVLVNFTVDWYKNANENNAFDLSLKQIEDYMVLQNNE